MATVILVSFSAVVVKFCKKKIRQRKLLKRAKVVTYQPDKCLFPLQAFNIDNIVFS